MTNTENKPWYKSKTIWIGILTVIGGVITAIADQLATGSAITAIGILNIILRFITKEGVSK